MLYITQFIVGGTVMMLASYLSQSKHLFLSGIITLLPILTLLNMRQQIKNMKPDTFHIVQANSIYGAIGMVIFTVLVFVLSNHLKPGLAVLYAFCFYAVFMLVGKVVIAWIQPM